MLRFVSIVFLCIAAAILYGLIHDQITIRVSLEYFTILHPQILPEDTSPTVLALAWGVIATWWVGLILGIILATASTAGSRPKLSAKDLVKPVFALLLVMAFGAFFAGLLGYFLMTHHGFTPAPWVLDEVPADKVTSAITAGFSHCASYGIGFVGGVVVAIRAWIRRGKLRQP